MRTAWTDYKHLPTQSANHTNKIQPQDNCQMPPVAAGARPEQMQNRCRIASKLQYNYNKMIANFTSTAEWLENRLGPMPESLLQKYLHRHANLPGKTGSLPQILTINKTKCCWKTKDSAQCWICDTANCETRSQADERHSVLYQQLVKTSCCPECLAEAIQPQLGGLQSSRVRCISDEC